MSPLSSLIPLSAPEQPASASRRLALIGLAATLAAGCTYIDERRDLMAGGPQQREAAAQAQLDAERHRSTDLTAQKAQRERDLDDVNRRLASTQTELDDQTRRLNAALRARKISQGRYDDLKRQADSIRRDAASMKLANDAARAQKVSAPLPPDGDKLKQLGELEQRRHDLETALQAAVGR